MELFYVRPENVGEEILILDDFERRHIVSTLRKATNATILVTDGQGTLFTGTIKETGPQLIVDIQKKERKAPKEVSLVLACGFIKQNRLDFILEKGTELGVDRFLFFRSRYANYFTENARRFHKVVRQALKQSLRYYLPEIKVFASLNEFFTTSDMEGLRLVAIDGRFPPLFKLLKSRYQSFGSSLTVAIGPEGGFSDDELQQFVENGFEGFSLGPSRLRTETAAIASLAIVNQFIH